MIKQQLFGVIEGFYVAQIAYHFQHNGVFARLCRGRTTRTLARDLGYDHQLLTGLLEFLFQASDLVERRGANVYSLNPKYRAYPVLGFQLDKFIGAYGPAAVKLTRSLKARDLGRGLVDREIQARAYFTIQSPPNPIVMQVARALRLRSVLDLGCGPGTMLTELCRGNSAFRGWGIDESRPMCRIARQRIAKAGLEKRVRVLHGDARRLGAYFNAGLRRDIDAVQCKGLFNELFRRGDSDAVDYLAKLKKWFPGKLLFVVDYYGKLMRVTTVPRAYQHTLIHDLIQCLSAQGTPPADLAGWRELYRKAGCTVEHACEGDHQGIEWFVHMVRL